MRSVRIFVSSPGDVLPERHRACQVIERLGQRFGEALSVEPVFWEWEPLTAAKHFQENIVPPSTTDVVVMILWSKLGTLLPKEKFAGRISGNQVTGTEWEFEDALGSYQETKHPILLVYVKKAPVEARFDDPDDPRLDAIREDKRRLNRFLKTWFWDEKEAVFKGSQRDFADTSTFEDMLERHLEKLFEQFIEKGGSVRLAGQWHRGSPFRGLQLFDVEHADIFFGRTRARNELRGTLNAQADRGSAFVVVLGASGSGKSSLVRAGLIPDLVLPGMVPGVGLVRYALLRPRDEDANPLAALASALMSALPELKPLEYTKNVLEKLIVGSAVEAMLPVKQGLSAARQSAKLAETAEARLLIVIDQFEELFTFPIPEDTKRRFVNALDYFARSSVAWVIATMRTEFIPRFAQVPQLAELARGAGTFLLSPPTPEELGQIILRPAEAAGLEYETDIRTGRRLDEELRRAAGNNPGALPLLEYLLERLWQERDAARLMTFDAYTRLGGLEGAIGQRAEELFLSLPEPVQQALPEVLRALVTVAWTEGAPAATSKTALLSLFVEDTPARRLIDALRAPDARLLVVDGDRVRVAHEALFVHWERAAIQIAEDQHDLRTRDRIECEAAEWQQATADTQAGLLIPPGIRLSDAEDLLTRRRTELSALEIEYIEACVAERTRAEVEKEDQRKRIEGEFYASCFLLAQQYVESSLYELALEWLLKCPDEMRNWEWGYLMSLAAMELPAIDVAELPVPMITDRPTPIPTSFDMHDWIWKDIEGYNVPYYVVVRSSWAESVLSRDGRLGISSGQRNAEGLFTPQVFEVESGKKLLELEADSEEVRNAGFSDDGSLFVIARGNVATIREVRTGREVSTLRGHMSAIWGAAFSPDATRIVTVDSDGSAKVWDVGTGRSFINLTKRAEWRRVTSSVTAGLSFYSQGSELWRTPQFSPDGRSIAISCDDVLLVWVAYPFRPQQLPDKMGGDWPGSFKVWQKAWNERILARFQRASETRSTELCALRFEKPIQVSTVEELVGAIGPNRVIELVGPGPYDLGDEDLSDTKFVRWDPAYDGRTLTIHDIEDLTILGPAGKQVAIHTPASYAFVLQFERCKRVILKNLTLGHAPNLGGCDRGVVGLVDSSHLSLLDCDLFGCGTEGLTMVNVSDCLFEGVTIRDCTYGMMSIRHCNRLYFRDTRFVNNEQFWGIDFKLSRDILLRDCLIEGNRSSDPLVNIKESLNIKFSGGRIAQNNAPALISDPRGIHFDGVEFEGNDLRGAKGTGRN